MMRHQCASVLLATSFSCFLSAAVEPRAAGRAAATLARQNPAPQSPPAPTNAPSPPPPAGANEPPNGISVGRPTVFDNRTLTLMLESLSETLRTLQVIDQKTIAAAFGLMQGSQSRDFSSSLTVSTTPTPATTEEMTTNTGLVSSGGTPLPDTTTRTTTTNMAAVTPQVPTLDTAANTIAGFNPQFGQHASDLLSDQVNLSYQIFNLRMILERSLSDRLVATDSPNADRTRLQAVLGFNVTIDPPRTAEDAVAVVEVTLVPQPPDRGSSTGISAAEQALSLVALMPQEKTYNASALSTKSNAFGGAAVAKMIHVGYSARRRGQTFYVYRDADTIAYERMGDGHSNDLTFGWMFRPVLGQSAVSPGLRQLFAVVSLPRKDVASDDVSQLLKARVRTYWKKYDRNTLTSFAPEHANRAARLRYFFSASLAKPQIFDTAYVNTATYSSIEVKPTGRYQQGLTPTITHVRWEIVGPKTAVLSVEGNNFFTGTQVVVGGKTYVGGGDGLLLKSTQAFDLTTTVEALAEGTGVVIGRYGAAVTLAPTSPGVEKLERPTLLHSTVGPPLGGTREFIACFNDLPNTNAPGQTRVQPILSVNAATIPPPYVIVPAGCQKGQGTTLIASVPVDAVPDGNAVFKLTWPFIPKLTSAHRAAGAASLIHVSQIAESSVLLTHSGPIGFALPANIPGVTPPSNPCWTILKGVTPVNLPTPGCKVPGEGTSRISDEAVTVTFTGSLPDKFLVLSPIGGLVTLELPKKQAAAEVKPIEVQQHDSVWIDVTVKDASAIKAVDAAQVKLPFRRTFDAKGAADPKKLQVQLTRDLTARAGTVELTFLDGASKAIGQVKIKVVCTLCGREGEK